MSEAERMVGRDLSPASLLLRRVSVLDPRERIDAPHDILIEGGEISAIAPPGEAERPDGVELIEAEGLLALPAFFDPHVHLRSPGQEHKEDLETGTRAAAAGGYCGIVAMANTTPPIDTPEAITALHQKARRLASIPVGFVATLTDGMRGERLSEMVALRSAGAIGFSDDGLPIRSAEMMRRAIQYQRLSGGFISLHEEDPELSGLGVIHEGEVSAALGLAGIPSISESTILARDAAIARYEGGRLNFQHLSAAASVEALEVGRAGGVELSAEVTPHHLLLTDQELRSLDARFKMNPPLRAENDRQALIAALRSGTIDCVATDHAPHHADEKEVPIEAAAMGTTGLETAFSALFGGLVEPGIISAATLVERMSAGASIVGLEPARIALGRRAEIALFDPKASWVAGADGWESRSANSCFGGRTLRGRVMMTVAAGQIAFRRRNFAIRIAR